MLRGLYTAASGMIAQQRRHDVITNNIANINTVGFKGGNAVNRTFPEMLVYAMGGPNPSDGKLGKLSTGVFAEENLLSMAQGDLRETYRSQDLALVSDIFVDGVNFDQSGKFVDANGQITYQPQAFFAVNVAGQERYTRDGSFKTAPDGTLVTSDGYPVTGADGQPIVVDRPWDAITVTANGRLVNGETSEPLPGAPQLRIMRVDNPNLLVREGDGRFRYAGEANGLRQIEAEDQVEVRQGFLERSNVDITQASIDLMAAFRAYEANQKVIQAYDRSLEKAVNEIGRV
ncbi:flagellar basal body rod protein [Cohnella sp. CIP 111063]|uniref:flagellar hook-basal body protein n=1 Tax=unclassified Cohnella TaxID=2636738 RepID=UPI000B8BF70C|nr:MULTISPECIES: flagellar hook-basal body protein [unclassified Cohnella]OXS55942.1 flagellar basal body rod protein [Cohnella sp. CIP 111063]PRX67150.1 flagellar basal-body rod protein FlgG [Cohnella sp. SGD-V74]